MNKSDWCIEQHEFYKDKVNHDNVTKPKHYQFSKPCNEVRDVIKDRVKRLLNENSPAVGYDKRELLYDYENSIKYLLRWFEKNGAEDLRKAKYCIDQMLCILEDGKDSTDQPIKCEPSNDVPVVDLDLLWEQEHMKVHPTIKEQFAEAFDKVKCGRIPIARFPPWS